MNSVEEKKMRAKAEKEHLIMLIAFDSVGGKRYTLDQLKGMKLASLQEIAKKLELI